MSEKNSLVDQLHLYQLQADQHYYQADIGYAILRVHLYHGRRGKRTSYLVVRWNQNYYEQVRCQVPFSVWEIDVFEESLWTEQCEFQSDQERNEEQRVVVGVFEGQHWNIEDGEIERDLQNVIIREIWIYRTSFRIEQIGRIFWSWILGWTVLQLVHNKDQTIERSARTRHHLERRHCQIVGRNKNDRIGLQNRLHVDRYFVRQLFVARNIQWWWWNWWIH